MRADSLSMRLLLALACATRTSGFVAPGPSPLRADAKIATRRRGAPELWDGYLQALEATPLPVKCATATCIIGAGDAAAQAIEGLKTKVPLDVARVGRWAFFGLVLQAPWNHYFQNSLEALLPSTPEPWTTTTALKVAIDQGIQAPIFTALIFVFFAVIEGRGVEAGAAQVRDELQPTLLKNWLIFLPATVINLGFVPLELRVLFINVVFFFWVIILSLLINETKQETAA